MEGEVSLLHEIARGSHEVTLEGWLLRSPQRSLVKASSKESLHYWRPTQETQFNPWVQKILDGSGSPPDCSYKYGQRAWCADAWGYKGVRHVSD